METLFRLQREAVIDRAAVEPDRPNRPQLWTGRSRYGANRTGLDRSRPGSHPACADVTNGIGMSGLG